MGTPPSTPTVNITLNGGELFNNGNNNTTPPNFDANRTFYLGPNGGFVRSGWGQTTTINGQITGPGGFGVVWDGGPVTLNGTSDYSGGTTIGVNGNGYYAGSACYGLALTTPCR